MAFPVGKIGSNNSSELPSDQRIDFAMACIADRIEVFMHGGSPFASSCTMLANTREQRAQAWKKYQAAQQSARSVAWTVAGVGTKDSAERARQIAQIVRDAAGGVHPSRLEGGISHTPVYLGEPFMPIFSLGNMPRELGADLLQEGGVVCGFVGAARVEGEYKAVGAVVIGGDESSCLDVHMAQMLGLSLERIP